MERESSPDLPPLSNAKTTKPSSALSSTQSIIQSSSSTAKSSNPQLPKTHAFVFIYGLIQRTLLSITPASVQYSCTQGRYKFSITVPTTKVQSTSNFIKHYQAHHCNVALTETNAQAASTLNDKEFFQKYPVVGLSQDQYRRNLMDLIISNNLPLQLTKSPSFYWFVNSLN
jgi:hypothetical protein